ncbi:MAG TPA: hypothetical protein VE399_00575 [Gemmatimonadales bacterium]|nr:hypothetical protein [Gemmatimonadales bacterium]
MRRILIAVMLTAMPAMGQAQGPDLGAAAEQARRAWFRHNPAALVADSPRLLIQLPGAEPSVALGPDQARALLADFLAAGQEVETLVRAAREVGPGRGYVELQRKYRVAGTQNVRTQALLLGYRLGQRGWVLVEFRVVG